VASAPEAFMSEVARRYAPPDDSTQAGDAQS
jgi:hypothetical protein